MSGEPPPFAPNPWLRIGADGSVTLLMDRSEMGQGAMGGLLLLVAEELRIAPARIAVEFAPAAPEYANPALGAQITGGSTSISAAWEPLRLAAAQARATLVATAAAQWAVDAAECRADDGTVSHGPTGRQLAYADLVTAARRRRPAPVPPLTPPAEFRWIGRRRPPPEVEEKLSGRIGYGSDVVRPGLLTAVVARCPVPGGRLRRVDAAAARKVPGVEAVFTMDSGVAVVARGLWAARCARERLETEWDEGMLARLDSALVEAALRHGADHEGEVMHRRGQTEHRLSAGLRRLDAAYHTPYLAHVPLETMNCTVEFDGESCRVWVPTQNQTATLEAVMQLTGLPAKRIAIHTTHLGGSFGRRLEIDFVVEAVEIARELRRPVQLVWSLDDDLAHDFYRPANLNLLQGGLDAAGRPLLWLQQTVGPGFSLGDVDVPYAVPNLRIETVEVDPGLPTGAWRSVGASQNAFAVESFIDELAHEAGADPCRFRHDLLGAAPRHRRVLERAAEAADWGAPLGEGCGRGIAVYHSYGSWVAQVAEVSLHGEAFRVDRIVCAVDCGIAVDPAGVEAQMEGAVAFGLSAALKERITLRRGRVQETDFEAYPLLRFSEMPEVEVFILDSDEPPGGVGESGVPPVAPAVANALFAASGRRLRRLPLLAEWH